MTPLSKLFISVITAALIVALHLYLFGAGSHYSTGTRSGTVVKLSERGLAVISWEGEMHMGQNAMGANLWRFSVSPKDKDTVMKLRAALDTSAPVLVTYRQWWHKPIWIDTEYVITGVSLAPVPVSGPAKTWMDLQTNESKN